MRNQKLIWLLAAMLILVLALAGCAATPSAEDAADTTEGVDAAAEASTGDGEKAKVDIFVGLGTGTDPDQVAEQEALAERFNSSHEDIEIEFVIVPNDESNERLIAMISGGEAPGLVGPGGVDVAARYLDMWEDVGPYIEAEGFDTSDFYGAAVDLYNYPEKTVGLPLGMFPSFIFYNKDHFDAAGLDYPTTDYADETWNLEAMREMAMALTLDENGNDANSPDFDPDSIVQWGFDDSWTDMRGYMTFFDPPGVGRPVSDDLKTAMLNSDEYQFGLDWLNQAVWEDHYMADYTGQEALNALSGDPFGGGMASMFHSHTWFMPEGLVDLPFEYGFAPVPYNQKDTRVARIHADTFYIPETAENKDASWEVLKWLTSEENIVDVCLVYGCLPARRSVQDLYTEQLMERYGENEYDVIFNAVDYLDDPHHESFLPNYGRVNDTIGAELFDRVYTEPIEDTQAVLEEVNANVQNALDEYWADQ